MFQTSCFWKFFQNICIARKNYLVGYPFSCKIDPVLENANVQNVIRSPMVKTNRHGEVICHHYLKSQKSIIQSICTNISSMERGHIQLSSSCRIFHPNDLIFLQDSRSSTQASNRDHSRAQMGKHLANPNRLQKVDSQSLNRNQSLYLELLQHDNNSRSNKW